ncbi:MAG: hypothetical protein RM049_07635 [Nostoc sp. DedQUE04]|uniref:hypothetical protein n=1 Tax=Nostoc sp. DedQUE04 TaxID=3075390 RepID=UPI002AD505F3|nr:hypothetical protein [Nostoc sp. DedQUE04]MDZ8135162.1 hypothetical protein [Nostoc sp. DedQUE04]
MADAINPRQFASLDYADADMYGALLERPAPAVPLQPSMPITESNRDNPAVRIMEKRLWEMETAHYPEYHKERVQREKAVEEEILGREQAQRQQIKNRINGIENPDLEPPRRESPVAQIQRSTPERQPFPSTGSPPPTISGTAARADSLVEPTATPRPAILREAIGNTIGGIGQTLPKALPQAAGRLVVPGVNAGLTFAGALIAGQSVTQAATTTAGVLAGGVVGGIIGTAIGGPLGGYIGSSIGSFAGGYLANALFPPQLPSGVGHLETFVPNYPPFLGGQGVGALYSVRCTWKTTFNGEPGDNQVMNAEVYGPISDIHLEENPPEGAPGCRIVARNADGSILNRIQGNGFAPATKPYGLQISITYVSGGTQDRYIDKTVPSPPPDNTPYRYDSSPVGNDNIIPSGIPAAGKNKPESRDIAPSMPSNNTPNGARGFVGHGGLAPSYLPNPEHQPSNLGGMLPAIKNAPQPLPFAEAEDIAVPRITPMLSSGEATTTATNPSTFAYPAYVPETAKPVPISDALSPVPKAKSQPSPRTPTEAANDDIKKALDEQKKDFDDQIKRLTAIATGLAALTPAIQGIPDAIAKSPTVQAANKETTQGAVCEIAQPGGCLGKAIDDSANKVNQNNNQNTANLLDKINVGANAAQLALLELINTKLGDLLPGGLSGTFTRLWQTLQVDRILNILILITTFHNALMLSNNLAQTLFAAIDNISQAVGFKWKNEKGEESGFGSIASEWTANFFKAIFGEANYTELVANYKKANRIYQATANIFNALQSIGYSILSALEVVGSYVALIGNALRKWGEVGESAYRWFNPQPNFHNKFFTTLEGTTNVVSQIDQVASEVVSVEQNIAQIGELKNELGKSIGEEDGSKQGVQPPEAIKVKAGFDASKLVSATGIAISDSDKEADE